MDNIKVGLTKKHWTESPEYIFPNELFDIVKSFSDFDTIYHYARERMAPYQGKEIDLYVSGGLSSELLEAVRAAAALNITCNLYYFDRDSWSYSEQPQRLLWKPQRSDENMPAKDFILCEGRRHPVDYPGIYKRIDRVFDYEWMEEQAERVLEEYKGGRIRLYLTGLSQATISVLNAAARVGVAVTMMVYDNNIEDYAKLPMD